MTTTSALNAQSRRLGGWAGMVFAVGTAIFVSLIVGGGPGLTDSMADKREYFDDAGAAYFLINWFGALMFVFGLLLFASALRGQFGGHESDVGIWSRASFAGAVLVVAVSGVGTFFWGALALNGADGVSDGTVQVLMNMDALSYGAIASWGFALFLVGAAMAITRTGAYAQWLAWLAEAAAVLHLIGALWVIDGDPESVLGLLGLLGFLLTLIWVFLMGLFMSRGEAKA